MWQAARAMRKIPTFLPHNGNVKIWKDLGFYRKLIT
jgi:hypothetical protein